MRKKLLSIIASGLMLASVQLANAQTGAALNFNGTNNYVSVPDNAVLNFGTGDFTIEADFQSSASQPSFAGIVAKDNPANTGIGWQLVMVNNSIAAEFTDGSTFFGTGQGLQGSITLNDGAWHHLAMVVSRASSSITLYVDGNVDVSVSDPAIATMNISSTTVPMLMGVDRDQNHFTNGTIDEVKIWNIARTQTAIQNNMNCAIAPATATGLVAYYNFNNGVPNANNTSITTTPDLTTNLNTGALNTFTLTGTTSNFVGNTTFSAAPAVTVNSATVCAGTATTLTATAATATSFSWNTSATTATITATPTITANYTVTVVDANNCTNWATNTVTVNDLPTVSINSTTICVGATTTLTATAPTATSYTWSNNSNGMSIIVTPTTTVNYSVTVTDVNNCSNSATNTVTVNNLPTVSINSATICVGATTTLTATAPTATSYSWNTSATTATITATPTVTAHYTVSVMDANNCSNSATNTVTVNNLPIVSVNSPTVCAGTTTTLTAVAFTATSYSWSTSATTASITATPTTTAHYTVTVMDANNCSKSVTNTVTVNNLPVVSANSATVCGGASTTTTLTATAPTATSYSWNTSATTATITATPTVTTHYTVTVMDANNCSNWATDSIKIASLPVVSANSATVCAGTTATLTATAPTATSYSWSTSATTVSVTATPTVTTHYTVTVMDANNCSNWAIDSISVNALPVVTANSKTVCVGSTAATTLTATAPTATSFSWSTGATTATITATPTVTTHYTVTVTGANNCINWAVDSIKISALPTVTITSTAGYSVCPGTTDTLKASGTATSYTWSPGNHAVTDYTVRPGGGFGGGNPTYTLTGMGANGCISKDTITLTLYPRATATITPSVPQACIGDSVTLSITTGTVTITSYTWSTGVANTSSITVTPTTPTQYSINLVDANGCTGRARYNLNVNPLPTITATSDSTGAICIGRHVILTGHGATTYTWSTSATTNTVNVQPLVTTTYTVMGTDMNGCTNTGTITQSVSSTCFVGIESYNNSANVSLYPNPNNGTFVVTTTEQAKTILVTDILGNQLISVKPTDNTTTINLNAQANGIYFVKIISDNNQQTVKRFVITN
jgi:hypothetical protein